MENQTIKSIVWTHDGDEVTCTVGEPIIRMRDDGPRVTRISDGERVISIKDYGAYFLVSLARTSDSSHRWANPFKAERDLTTQVVFADDTSAP